jgi:hypothetical protein
MKVPTRQKNWSIEAMELMFYLGAHTEELKACISEKENMLRLKGAKLRNRPTGTKASASFIAALPEPALEIVRVWFSKKAKFEQDPSFENAVKYFKDLEFDDYSDESSKKYWRAILCAYCQKNPDEKVVEFLQKQPESKIRKSKPIEPIEPTKPKEKLNLISVDSKSLTNCIESLKNQEAIDQAEPLYIFALGVIAAAKNEIKTVEEISKAIFENKISDSKKVCEVFDQILKATSSQKKSLKLNPSANAETFGYIDPEQTFTLATITNHLSSGQFFARVEGVLVGDKLVILSSAEAKEIFKFSGDITGYKNKLTSNHYDGEIGLWRVVHQNTEKKTQYAITEHQGRVYEIIEIPHGSDDPDSVRTWIQTIYKQLPGIYPIFELKDGLLVRAHWELTDVSNTKFEKALDIFEDLQAFLTPQGKRIVIGPLPVSSKKYDCAPVGTLIKRILRVHDTSLEFPAFTKNQAQLAADFLSSQDVEILESNLNRTKVRLQNAANVREQIEESIQLILAIPEVANAVESEKSRIIAEFIKNRISEENVLIRMRAEQTQVLESIDAAKKTAKQIEVDISKQIKNAFERASKEGVKTLAEVAVFKSILTESTSLVESKKIAVPTNQILNPLKTITQGNPIQSITELSNSLSRAATASNLSPQLIQYIASALLASSATGLVGKRRSLIAPTIASVFSSGIYCQLSVGADVFSPADLMLRTVAVFTPLSRFAMPLGDFIDYQTETGQVCIVDVLGSNRAPLDSYIPELIEHASNLKSSLCLPWTDSKGNSRGGYDIPPLFFLLNFVSGKSTFPISNEMFDVIPLCDVSHKWGDEDEEQSIIKLPNRHIEINYLHELLKSFKSEKFNVGDGMRNGLMSFGMSESDAEDLTKVAFSRSRNAKNIHEITGIAKIQKDALDRSQIALILEDSSNK